MHNLYFANYQFAPCNMFTFEVDCNDPVKDQYIDSVKGITTNHMGPGFRIYTSQTLSSTKS